MSCRRLLAEKSSYLSGDLRTASLFIDESVANLLLEARQRLLHEPRMFLLLLEGCDKLRSLVERVTQRIAEGLSLLKQSRETMLEAMHQLKSV